MAIDISIIVSTYNRHDALLCVLNSLNRQTNMSFEVIIADDGSSINTKDVVTKFQEGAKFKITHVWQKDDGFRAAQIRNKAVAHSKGDYLIFIDGDCVVFPKFIERHIQLEEEGYFVRGSRVMLSESFTQEFITSEYAPSSLKIIDLLHLWKSKKIKRIIPLTNIPIGYLRKLKKREWYGVKTCNLGIWREDFISVNGFDENYIGWGHEDADLAVRLIKNGVYRKEGIYSVTVLHLWHPFNDRSNLQKNVERLKQIQISDRVKAQIGVSQYLN